MNTFELPRTIRSVMCLGAHPDDIEIGAGATLAYLAERHPEAVFHLAILTGSAERAQEAATSAEALFGGRAELSIAGFADGFVPYESPGEAKRFVRGAIPVDGVDIVFAPQTADLHQDHRFLGEIARQVFRDHVILEYEIVKFDGGLTPPNVYVPMSRSAASAKVAHLRESFPSQTDNSWFTDDAFMALMRLRGIESNAPEGFAEAFTSSKIVLS